MFQHLFNIFIRPKQTLDAVLIEHDGKKSWAATWFIVGAYAVVLFLVFSTLFRSLNVLFDAAANRPAETASGLPMFYATLGVVLAVLYVIAQIVGGRYLWAWFVQLGLMISANDHLPRDSEERRIKGERLRLIHPYTTWISELPYLLVALGALLFLSSDAWERFIDSLAFANDPDLFESMLNFMFGLFLYGLVAQIFLLGMTVYMTIVRVIAIMRIYRITASQAFWGPFLIYVVVYGAFYMFYFILSLLTNFAL